MEDTLIQSYPWLQWSLFYRVSQNTSSNVIDDIRDKEICAYCDGWLVLKEANRGWLAFKEAKIYYLMNIHTLKKIRLPSVSHKYTRCLLTCSPNDSGSLVLFLARNKISCCRPGDKSYKKYYLEKGMYIWQSMVALFEGKVYYLIEESDSLGVIDCCGSSLQFTKITVLPPSYYSEIFESNNYLVESGGELLKVVKGYSQLYLKLTASEIYCFLVFRFDFLNKNWMKVENIGKYTIFLPRERGFSHGISFCATNPQIKQNSIYFLRDDDEYLHVYDLENHSLTFLPNRLEMLTLHIQEQSNENLDDEDQNTTLLPQFPAELSKLIFDHLFTLDPGAVGVLRSVRKDWGSIVRPPTSEVGLRYNKYPYLVTLVNGICKFLHPTYDHTFCRDIPELLGARIKFSKFGWLLLSRDVREPEMAEYFFFNPFTNQKIDLPKAELPEFRTMSFSSPPTSSDCFIVAVTYCNCQLAFVRCGEDKWCFSEEYEESQRVVNYHPVFYKQKCYCFGADKKLIVVDLNTTNISMVGKTFSTNLVEFNGCFLVEDEEGLLGVFLLTEKKIPHLMRMDLTQTKKLWQPLKSLNNKMIYVSPAASRLDSAPTKSTGNKIYFPLFRNSSNVFYSFSTRKYHTFSGDYSCSGTMFEVRSMTNCAWIDVE